MGSHKIEIEMDHKAVPGVLTAEAYEDVDILGNTIMVVTSLTNCASSPIVEGCFEPAIRNGIPCEVLSACSLNTVTEIMKSFCNCSTQAPCPSLFIKVPT